MNPVDPSVTKRETGSQSLRLEEPRGFISDPCAGFPFIPAFRRHVCTQLCVEAERGSQLGSEAARLARVSVKEGAQTPCVFMM